VALAALWGMWAAERQFQRRLLDVGIGNRLGLWVLLGGVVGAHLFSVLFYYPDKLRSDPWLLLRLWEDISSFGGILGGVVGALLFFRLGPGRDDRARQYEYLDGVARVFPVSFAIGRLGCALAHDHPGTVTRFPLAISMRTREAFDYIASLYSAAGTVMPLDMDPSVPYGFHDLGWYEFLFLSLVVVPLFQLWQRRDKPGGFYLIAFPLTYLPVRFGLDFLRIGDVRYAGLTPAQWVAMAVLLVIGYVMMDRRREARSEACD
jgi:phosphatidylglycerol---prolipoprotein diacylglyceryl transferase